MAWLYIPRHTNGIFFLIIIFFLQKACGKNTFFVHNNSLPERHYQMYAVANKIAKLKTASQFATVRLRASTAFYFLLRYHITKWDNLHVRLM